MKNEIGSFLILMSLLSACGTPVISEPTKEIHNTQTPVVVVSPMTPATKTSMPHQPLEQIAITATQQALPDTPGANCYYGSADEIRISPNGQWAEAICDPYFIIITRLDGTKEWSLSSSSLIAPHTDHFVYLAHWSNDGSFAYISVDPHTDGYWEPFHQGIVLYQLNLETGQINEVLPLGKSDWTFYSYSFSPNDRRLAYIVTDRSPVILNIRNMQTGNEQLFELNPKYNTGGGFMWSQDSQKLVFSVGLYLGNDDFITSLFLWDENQSKVTELATDFQGQLQAVEWANNVKIILEAVILDQEQLKIQNYELDLTNNKMTELNP